MTGQRCYVWNGHCKFANSQNWKNSKVQKYFQNFVKYFAHRRQEEGGKLTTGDREEVTDIGLGGGWGLAGIRGRDATKYKLEFVDKYF